MMVDDQLIKTKKDNANYMAINLFLFIVLGILLFFYRFDEAREPTIFAIANVSLYLIRSIFHSVVICYPTYSGRYSVINMFIFLVEVAVTSYGVHQGWTLGKLENKAWLLNTMIWLRLVVIILAVLMLIVILFFVVFGEEEPIQSQESDTFIPQKLSQIKKVPGIQSFL